MISTNGSNTSEKNRKNLQLESEEMIVISRIVVSTDLQGKRAKIVSDQLVKITTSLTPDEFKTNYLKSKRYKNKVVDLTYMEA